MGYMQLFLQTPFPPIIVFDMTLIDLMVRFSDAGTLMNAEYHFIAIATTSTLAPNGSTW